MRNWIKSSKINVFKTPGGHYRILKSELIRLMQAYKFPIPEELQKKHISIYIVDDNIAFLQESNNYFSEKENIKIQSFSNGFDALLALINEIPDAMLINQNLPKMNSIELIKKLKQNHKYNSIKMILLTENGKIPSQALKLGINASVRKKDGLESITEKIIEIIN